MSKRKRLSKVSHVRRPEDSEEDDDLFEPKRPRFDDSQLPDFSCPRSLAMFIEKAETLFGNTETSQAIEDLTYTTREYSAQKIRVINRFYRIIAAHPTLSALAEFTQDPERDNEENKVTKFVLLTRGIKTKCKNKIVNTCLILVAQRLRLKSSNKKLDWSSFWIDKTLFTKEHANACYQPNVSALFHRQLFKYFHDEGLMFSLANDFNYKGGFQAYWTELFKLVKEKRQEFGELPNKAFFDPQADYKIRHNANPPYTPFELSRKGYDDCMDLMAHYTCVDFCLRGATEVSNSFFYIFA